MKEEALKLADESQRQSSLVYLVADEPIAKQMSQMFLNYSAMIRRLVEELDKQWYMVNKDGYVKPLSDEEIENIYWSSASAGYDGCFSFKDFARAIEERHGIK